MMGVFVGAIAVLAVLGALVQGALFRSDRVAAPEAISPHLTEIRRSPLLATQISDTDPSAATESGEQVEREGAVLGARTQYASSNLPPTYVVTSAPVYSPPAFVVGKGLKKSKGTIRCDSASDESFGCLSPNDFENFSEKLSEDALEDSTDLLALIDDETGTGSLVFGTAPTIEALRLSGISSSLLATDASGQVVATTSITIAGLAVTGNGTTTFENGIDLSDGCFAVNGVCISGGGGGGSGTVSSGTQGQLAYYATNGTTLSGTSSITIANLVATGTISAGTTSALASLTAQDSTTYTGAEMITNGTFTGDASGWTLGDCAVYGANSVTVTYTACSEPYIGQSISLTTGQKYRVDFDISGQVGTSSTDAYIGSFFSTADFGNGRHSFVFTARTTGASTLWFDSNNYIDGDTFTIDNVSVRPVTYRPALNLFGLDGTPLMSLAGIYEGNLSVGIDAIGASSTGYNNTAFGNSNLRSNTTGSYNAAFGLNNLRSNTTGSLNLAMGVAALNSNTTGSNNSAMGQFALSRNISGSNNNALGRTALRSNITGSNNIGVGEAASYSNTTGSNNIALGLNSIYNTTGSNNIAIGQRAAENITSAWGNIAIGERTYMASTTAARQLNIGNILFGTLPATSTSFQLPTTGGIGIGSTSPSALLSIHANNGDTRTNLFVIGSTSGSGATSTLFTVRNNGNVRIGTTSTDSNLLVMQRDSNLYDANIIMLNAGTGDNAHTQYIQGEDSSVKNLVLMYMNSGYTPYDLIAAPNTASLRGQGTGGLVLAANDASGVIKFATAGTGASNERMRITSTGLVGIGTTSPNARLSVDTTSLGTTSAFTIGSSTATLFTVTNNGNVGIGTATPAYKLHIVSDSSGVTAPQVADDFVVENNSAAGISILTPSSSIGRLNFSDTSGSLVGGFAYNHTSDTLTIRTAASDQMTLDSSGRLGIGTTSPNARLSVDTTSLGTTSAFTIGSSTGTLFTVTNTGSVGVGTTSPSAMFSVNGASFFTATVTTNANISIATGFNLVIGGTALSRVANTLRINATSVSGEVITYAGGDTATPKTVLTTGGNFGIGSTSPQARLSVDTTSLGTTSAFLIGSSTRTLLMVANNGNVGIGTTSPQAQLTTTGTVQFASFGAGSLQTDANGNVSVSSDERMKDIEGGFTRGLSAVLGIEPIMYRWKDETGYDTANVYTGFSAQNIEEFIPEAVGEGKNGFLTLSDRPILAAIINAIKEMRQRFTTSELCLDDVCITKDELRDILEATAVNQSSGGSGGSTQGPDVPAVPPPAPEETPEPTPEEPIVDESLPPPVSEPAPEPTPEPAVDESASEDPAPVAENP